MTIQSKFPEMTEFIEPFIECVMLCIRISMCVHMTVT